MENRPTAAQINMMDYHIAKLTPNAEYYCIVPTFYSVDVEKNH